MGPEWNSDEPNRSDDLQSVRFSRRSDCNSADARGDFVEIMEMMDKRLNDKGKNWRHVFKVSPPVQAHRARELRIRR